MSYRSLVCSASIGAMMPLLAVTSVEAGGPRFLSDVVVDGSLCVGIDCPATPSFGFDTQRFQENNLRVHFQDSSSSASFPSNDWRIRINDSSNGGANYFAVEDATAARTPFLVEAGARNNALYVEADSDVGIGNANPVVNLHITEGNTPTVRLEQDGSSGFTPQTYDIAANEANFFIRDVTNSSRLFFRAKPGAPEDSIYIAADGDIGMGTDNPSAGLHMLDNGQSDANLLIEDNDGRAQIWLEEPTNSTSELKIELGSDQFAISFNGTGNAEMQIDRANGNLLLPRGGLISQSGGGACTAADPCDAVFDPALYTVPTIEDHAALMWQNKHLPAVGPTGPGIPINVTEKMLRMLNELEHAHIYIEQLNDAVKSQRDEIAELREEVAILRAN